MIGRFGGAPAPAGVKFSFWRSMADLGRLVLRSGAPFLKARLGLALGLVFAGKFAGVWAPVVLGDAVSGLSVSPAAAASLTGVFVVGVLVWAALNLVSVWTPYARDAIF